MGTTLEKLVDGLRHFRENVLWERKALFERSAGGQRPLALLVTCSDSRVLPDTLMAADPGDLFVSRNAGNLVPPPDAPGGEAATVEYAVAALGVTDLVVCGHYRCGAVKALLHPEEVDRLPKVAAWLEHAAETRAVVDRDFPGLEGDARWDKAVEVNVLVQVRNLQQHPVVAAGLAAGTLRLHAWVLRFESGEVVAYDPAAGVFAPLTDMPTVRPAVSGPAAPPGPPEPAAPATPGRRPEPDWSRAWATDLPASLVVFLVALPLCLAIAGASGLPPEAGIVTGVVGGILVGLLAGSPLQVSGPAAGLVVVLLDVVQSHGLGRLGVVVLLAGLIQLAAGGLGLGRWFRAVSPAVILGMLAGIGVILFAQQFHVLVDHAPDRAVWRNLVTLPHAVWAGVASDEHADHDHRAAAAVGLLTLLTLVFWGPLARGRLKSVPAVLVAVTLATAVAAGAGLAVQRVRFDSLAAGVSRIDLAGLPRLLLDGSVWATAGAIALVASAETLLCAAAVDRMHAGPRTKYDRELAAQGAGNAVCGVLGVLPLTGVIVRSAANVRAGARTRLSAVLHGGWLLAFALLLPGALREIPTAALAAILVLTGVRLVEVHAVRALWRESRTEGLIFLATLAGVVAVDLLTGVLVGVGLSVLKLVHTFTRFRVRRRDDPGGGRVTLILSGAATFVRLPDLAAALEGVPPGSVLHVDFRGLSYIDHACLTLLTDWEEQHAATGGQLVIDWDVLQARFSRGRPG
jgi:MFS superfamily sulfate permease-like transporter/carbonic anhydrase